MDQHYRSQKKKGGGGAGGAGAVAGKATETTRKEKGQSQLTDMWRRKPTTVLGVLREEQQREQKEQEEEEEEEEVEEVQELEEVDDEHDLGVPVSQAEPPFSAMPTLATTTKESAVPTSSTPVAVLVCDPHPRSGQLQPHPHNEQEEGQQQQEEEEDQEEELSNIFLSEAPMTQDEERNQLKRKFGQQTSPAIPARRPTQPLQRQGQGDKHQGPAMPNGIGGDDDADGGDRLLDLSLASTADTEPPGHEGAVSSEDTTFLQRAEAMAAASSASSSSTSSASSAASSAAAPAAAIATAAAHDAPLLIEKELMADPVHTNMDFSGLCRAIVDTPQFQRLHCLKQLGTTDFVFRDATHTRFSHSVGVAHLAERLVKVLRSNQPELGITDTDMLCVKVAGLCHDLGHGPYSHVFDGLFISRMHPNGIDGRGQRWRHEDGSVRMMRHLIAENEIDLVSFGLDDRDITFVEEMIAGTAREQRQGRGRDKEFLYDIVNNIRSGLDVDKLDYFMRDMRHTGMGSQVNFDRFIELARVTRGTPIPDVDGPVSDPADFPLMICYPEKLVSEAVALFSTRFNMHQRVYTHKATKQIEYMIVDAMELANDHIRIRGRRTPECPDGLYTIAQTIYDMDAFTQLTDSILHIISMAEPHPDHRDEAESVKSLEAAKNIIQNIYRRRLYVCVGRTRVDAATFEIDAAHIRKAIVACQPAFGAKLVSGPHQFGMDYPIAMPTSTATAAATSRAEEKADERRAQFLDHGLSGWGDVDDHNPRSVAAAATAAATSSGRQDDRAGAFGGDAEDGDGDGDAGDGNRDAAPPAAKRSRLLGATSAGPTFTAVVTNSSVLEEDDLIIDRVNIHYGSKSLNPVDRLRFFPKHANRGSVAAQIDSSKYGSLLPLQFQELSIRVFCRHAEKEAIARQAFERWCTKAECPSPFPSASQPEPGL